MKIFVKYLIINIILLVFFLPFNFVLPQKSIKQTPDTPKPRNIILMIGDGMGLPQVYAAMTANSDNLNMTKFPHLTMAKTFSADNYITDSAAGSTALACGVKTNNGMVGMLPDSTAVKSILLTASEKGLSTGLVATSDVTHATPAAFVASVASRKMAGVIAFQYLDSGIDVFIGGGLNNFVKRSDSLNLVDSLKKRNYHVALTMSDLMSVENGRLAGLIYPDHPPKVNEGRGEMLSLATGKAIEILRLNENGFFLMVEGSQIDWAGHDNDLQSMIDETIDFDKAVGVALEFARQNAETLVIVTADHETGGFTNLGGNFSTGEVYGSFSTDNHSAAPVTVFTFGPGAEQFQGFLDNTDIYRLMYKLLGFDE
ncbi:MAG: alkaline phosphatase [Lentimicrobium sp.]|nr:alkaline phosphatase [Lentimicrobium sp.]